MKDGTVCSQLMEDGVFSAEEKEQRLVALRRSC